MGWKRMLRECDNEELTYQMAYDLIEADEMKSATRQSAATRPTPSSPQWIDLAGPDVFEKLKQRMGMA